MTAKKQCNRRKFLALFLSLSLVIGLLPLMHETTAHAGEIIAQGYCGDLSVNDGKDVTWELDDSGTLTISGTGAMYWDWESNDWDGPGYYNYKYEITGIVIEDGVTEIMEGAFINFVYVTSVTISDSVESIGASAFAGCNRLTTMIIPEGVTSIGEYAFYECNNLTSVYVNSAEIPTLGNDAFTGSYFVFVIYVPSGKEIDYITAEDWSTYANNIESEEIIAAGFCGDPDVNEGKDVIYLLDKTYTLIISGSGAITDGVFDLSNLEKFNNKITNIEIKNGVTSIGAMAFAGCSSLKNVSIPDGVTSIGKNAFEYCSSLTTVSIPNSMTSIESDTFIGCSSLKNISIPDSVKSIGEGAFEECSSLTTVNIPDSVENIGNRTFAMCSNLTTVNIPKGMTNIGEEAFDECYNLTSVYVDCDEIPTLGINAFPIQDYLGIYVPSEKEIDYINAEGWSTYINNIKSEELIAAGFCGDWYINEGKDVMFLLDNTYTLTISGSGSIADSFSTFKNIDGLKNKITNIVIKNGVTSIGDGDFYEFSKLTAVSIPVGVKSIGKSAFAECSSLTTVNISNGVESIGDSAFDGCSKLTSVYVNCTEIPNLGDYVFDNTPNNMVIYVPVSVVDAYKEATGWSSYKDKIEAYEKNQKEIAGLGTSVLRSPRNPEEYGDNVWGGDHVYFGKYDGTNPTRYMVLDPDSHDFGVENGSILLNSDRILYYTSFDNDGVANVEGHNPNEWAISDMKANLNGGDFLDKAGNFTDAEKSAIAGSTKATPTNETGNSNYGYAPLNGEKVFLLDISEATTPSYGFRKADVKRSVTRQKDGPKSFCWDWWMRSPKNSSNDEVICFGEQDVYDDGYIISNNAKWQLIGVSPAFNISKSSVIFSSLVNYAYKLTIKDDDLNIATTPGKRVIFDEAKNIVTVPYTMTDNSTSSTPSQISIVVTDDTWTDAGWSEGAEVLQYSMLETVNETTEDNVITGMGKFRLNYDITGTWGIDYHVYILAEDVKTDAKLTDYASIPFELPKPEKVGSIGDVNGDGVVNAKDVTILRRYITGGWSVTVIIANSDVNGDGTINAKDVTILRRFLAGGWGVVLGKQD